MRLADPYFLLLLAIPLLLQFWRGNRNRATAPFPATEPLVGLPVSLRQRLRVLVPMLRILAICLAVVALARPQYGVRVSSIEREGIAIALVLDTSTSMSALDLEIDGDRRNRLAVSRLAVERFIEGRAEHAADRDGDAIGLVTFARFADSVSPPTLDHAAVIELLKQVALVTDPEEDGTAIGDALMLAIERLRDAGDAGRVVILLTDGSHNAGETEPMVAAEIARSLGMRIYTIGAGTKGMALMPTPNREGGIDYLPAQVFIDEFVLESIAKTTGGRYFRATDGTSLFQIYEEIERLETGVNVVRYHQHYREIFPVFVVAALMLLVLEAGLSATWLRVAP